MIWKAFWMMICLKITSTQWFVLIWNIFCNKKSSLFHWEVFHEINVNQTTLKLYTSWMYGKNQHRSTIKKHGLLWNKCMNINILQIYLLEISLTHYMALVFFCTLPEKRRFLDVFIGHWKRPVSWKGLRVI